MRPAGQVHASAANMDRALAAGLPRQLLLVLILARAARRAGRTPDVDPAALRVALRHPAARLFDELFVHRETRRP